MTCLTLLCVSFTPHACNQPKQRTQQALTNRRQSSMGYDFAIPGKQMAYWTDINDKVASSFAQWLTTTVHLINRLYWHCRDKRQHQTLPTLKLARLTMHLSMWISRRLSYYAQPHQRIPSCNILTAITGLLIVDGHNMNVNNPGMAKLHGSSNKLHSSCKIISHAMKSPDGGH